MIIPGKDSLDVGLMVKDLQGCVKFYQNVLGLSYMETVDLWFGKMVRLKYGESEFKIIKPDEEPLQAVKGLYNTTGFRLVTFRVKNIEEAYDYLQEQGVEFIVPLKESLPGIKITMFYDPEGNVVELVEK